MKWIVAILPLVFSFLTFSQEENNAEVNYLNYDPFLDGGDYSSSPVLPYTSNTQRVGFNLARNNQIQNEKYYFDIFPVTDIVSSYKNDNFSSSSLYGGLGIGIAGQFTEKFYGRIIVTGDYHLQNGSFFPSDQVFRTDLWSWDIGKNQSLGIQPSMRLSYSPYDFLNIQTGIDQNFIGQGNRSLLLGDYGAPYPFVQLRTKIWKIEVTNLYQFFKETRGKETFQKYASTHFFNYNITKRLQFGIFESVVFAPKDTLTNRGYEFAYLNPILFYRPTEYSLGSQDRLQIGINMSYAFNNVMLYAQAIIDEFVLRELLKRTRWWANKYGGQFGIKGKHDFENGKKLKWLAEINATRPFLYAHFNSKTNYGNQGRPLAHPLGANFVEVYAESEFQFNPNFDLQARFFFVQQGGFDGNDSISYGKDIYQSYQNRPFEHGYKIGGNGKVNRIHFSVEGGYYISKKLQLRAFVRPGIEVNDFTGSYKGQFLILGGIRSNLWNERSFGF